MIIIESPILIDVIKKGCPDKNIPFLSLSKIKLLPSKRQDEYYGTIRFETSEEEQKDCVSYEMPAQWYVNITSEIKELVIQYYPFSDGKIPTTIVGL